MSRSGRPETRETGDAVQDMEIPPPKLPEPRSEASSRGHPASTYVVKEFTDAESRLAYRSQVGSAMPCAASQRHFERGPNDKFNSVAADRNHQARSRAVVVVEAEFEAVQDCATWLLWR